MQSGSEKKTDKDSIDQKISLIDSKSEGSLRQVHRGILALIDDPIKEWYRLVVDGQLHARESGWLLYSKREPGCFKAIFDGLDVALTDLEDTTLSEKLILNLHAACTKKVEKMEVFSGQFRKTSVGNKFNKSQPLTQEGLLNILNMIEGQSDYPPGKGSWIGNLGDGEKMDSENAISYQNIAKYREKFNAKNNAELAAALFPLYKTNCIYLAPQVGEQFSQKLQALMKEYNTRITEAKDDEARLNIIVHVVHQLCLLHPFADANTRTFVILLLNRLLIQNGFVPATFENPNCEGFSESEFRNNVKQAMNNTAYILKGKKDMFGFKSSEIREEHNKIYQESIDNFTKRLSKTLKKLQTEELLELFALIKSNKPFSLSDVTRLIKKIPNLNIPDKMGNILLLEAVKSGHIDIVTALLDANVDLTSQKKVGSSALMIAVMDKRFDIAEKLLETFDDLNIYHSVHAVHGIFGTPIDFIAQEYNLMPDSKSGESVLREREKVLSIVNTLLDRKAPFSHYSALFTFLRTCDQRHPHVSNSMSKLCEKLQHTSQYELGEDYQNYLDKISTVMQYKGPATDAIIRARDHEGPLRPSDIDELYKKIYAKRNPCSFWAIRTKVRGYVSSATKMYPFTALKNFK